MVFKNQYALAGHKSYPHRPVRQSQLLGDAVAELLGGSSGGDKEARRGCDRIHEYGGGVGAAKETGGGWAGLGHDAMVVPRDGGSTARPDDGGGGREIGSRNRYGELPISQL